MFLNRKDVIKSLVDLDEYQTNALVAKYNAMKSGDVKQYKIANQVLANIKASRAYLESLLSGDQERSLVRVA